MTRKHAAAALVALLGTVASVQAQQADPRDTLYDLATLEADHDICGFTLSDEQREVIAQRRDALVTHGDVSEADVAAVGDQVAASLRRQQAEGLCRPDGAEARAFKRRLAALGLL